MMYMLYLPSREVKHIKYCRMEERIMKGYGMTFQTIQLKSAFPTPYIWNRGKKHVDQKDYMNTLVTLIAFCILGIP